MPVPQQKSSCRHLPQPQPRLPFELIEFMDPEVLRNKRHIKQGQPSVAAATPHHRYSSSALSSFLYFHRLLANLSKSFKQVSRWPRWPDFHFSWSPTTTLRLENRRSQESMIPMAAIFCEPKIETRASSSCAAQTKEHGLWVMVRLNNCQNCPQSFSLHPENYDLAFPGGYTTEIGTCRNSATRSFAN
jgi:hypothetical protein